MNTPGYLKVIPWSKEKAKKELKRRLDLAMKVRSKKWENQWKYNEEVLFSSSYNEHNSDVGVGDIYDAMRRGFNNDLDGMQINYSFKYLRFIHAQMSANPPSVIPVPTSTEYKDRRTARVADAFIQHARRKFDIQEKVDLTTLQTITYGTGFTKCYYDPYAGESWEFNEATSEILMQGDIAIKPVLLWDIWLDYNATMWEEVEWIFEKHLMDYEEAMAKFPDSSEAIEKLKGNVKVEGKDKEELVNLVEIFEYTEKATPLNGMDGRHIYCLKDGELLSSILHNPHPSGKLPYKILTDVDVPGEVYGKTFIDYIVQLQDILNRMDSTVLDNVRNHGVARMVLMDGAELAEDDISNDSIEVINVKGTGGNAPHFMPPPTLMPDMFRLRQQIELGMESLAGVNESMMGQVKREMSGYSLQTAINAGNLIRRRLFNKYEKYVREIYGDYLENVKEHYTDSRKLLITGEEEAMSVAYYSASDLSGGYDLSLDYGTAFSLDPASRREEIMQLRDVLKEAGTDGRGILKLLRLNEVKVAFDMAEAAERRQLEIFDEMIAKYEQSGLLIEILPEKNEEHAGMLETAKEFRMSMTFKLLDKELRDAIDAHIDARMQMLADMAAPAPVAPATIPPGLPPGIAAPIAPGIEPPIIGG